MGGRVSAVEAFGDNLAWQNNRAAEGQLYTQQPTAYPQQPVYNSQPPVYIPQQSVQIDPITGAPLNGGVMEFE